MLRQAQHESLTLSLSKGEAKGRPLLNFTLHFKRIGFIALQRRRTFA